ncbi:hypothetical protein ACEPPN_001641 [Leptodophora sp. 'Broadleaf-Isolate-01']
MLDQYNQEQFLKLYPAEKCHPIIADFAPRSAVPGSLIVIIGHGFAGRRDLNTVTIGGHRAIVVTAEHHRLVVISNKKSSAGPLKVKTHFGTAVGPRNFVNLPWPSPDSLIDAPPHSFEGVGTAKVLAVCMYLKDVKPADLGAAKTNMVNLGNRVVKYYQQASYRKLTVQFDVTDFEMLDNLDRYYLASSTEKGYPNFKKLVLPQIFAEAVQKAKNASINVGNYDVFLVMCHLGTFVRAWGGGSVRPNFHFEDQTAYPGVLTDINVGKTLGSIALGDDADWGRVAHEFGHNIVSSPVAVFDEDIYDSDLPPGADSSAQFFDLMGQHDTHPLFSGFYMDQLGWYKAQNIKQLPWSTAPFREEYNIVAHSLSENADTSRFNLVKIKVSTGMEYWIEV